MNEAERSEEYSPAIDQFVVFKLHNELFGFGISLITEIIEVVKMNFVPRVPDFVIGAINYHGRIVAIVDLADFFHFPSKETDMHTRIIVIEKNNFSIGFLVEEILEITDLSQAPEEGKPLVEAEANNKYIENILYVNDTLCHIIDVESLLANLKNYFEGDTIDG